jgi:predicted alpha-1,2-mannosidase
MLGDRRVLRPAPLRSAAVKRIRTMLGIALLVLLCGGSPAHAAFDPARYVNTFNGTNPGAQDFGTGGGAGNTFPGAVLPFGMVQLSPDTLPAEKAFGGGYTYGDRRIKGFSFKHMSGPGCAAYQDFPITPTTAPIADSPAKPLTTNLDDSYASNFNHAHESAQPGYYGVTLNPGTADAIDAQLTATRRTGFARFAFPQTHSASLLINASGSAMGASDAAVQLDPPRHEISGSVTSGQFCYQRNRYKLYFAARFSRPFAASGTWKGGLLLPGSASSSDSIPSDPFVYQPIPGGPTGIKDGGITAQTGAYATFDTTAGRTVEVRVGLSFVSADNARANLAAESGAASFEAIRARARETWNAMLSRIRVEDGTRLDRRRFYTQLYHALIHPSTFSDTNGEYAGFDTATHRTGGRTQYADFSGWDTYRTQMPLIAMIAPRAASNMVVSLLADARQSGYLPKWSQANGHTHVMVGDPADPLIAGAYAFGARGFDRAAALAAMIKGGTQYRKASTSPDYYERPGLPDYLGRGYVPFERNTDSTGQTFQPESVWGTSATTLEYALADFSIARMAAARCDRGTYASFMRRSSNWRNVFDPSVRYAQPRNADGSFKREDPSATDGFVEGSAAQYTLFVPHDPAGLFAALGGRRAARNRLDAFFKRLNAGPSSPNAFLGNEPTLGTPWLYHWAGEPYKAQRIVRRAMLDLYADTPGGMPGNDDLGAMSSWWVLSALGLYPAVPGTDVLTLGGPLFPSARVRLANRVLRISAPRAREGRPYVRGLTLDGRPRRSAWLRFQAIRRGGTLRFDVSSRADTRFAAERSLAPPSFPPSAVAPACRK